MNYIFVFISLIIRFNLYIIKSMFFIHLYKFLIFQFLITDFIFLSLIKMNKNYFLYIYAIHLYFYFFKYFINFDLKDRCVIIKQVNFHLIVCTFIKD